MTEAVKPAPFEIIKVGLGGYVIGRRVEKGIKVWKEKAGAGHVLSLIYADAEKIPPPPKEIPRPAQSVRPARARDAGQGRRVEKDLSAESEAPEGGRGRQRRLERFAIRRNRRPLSSAGTHAFDKAGFPLSRE